MSRSIHGVNTIYSVENEYMVPKLRRMTTQLFPFKLTTQQNILQTFYQFLILARKELNMRFGYVIYGISTSNVF